ncbi:translation initiation factor IF-2 [Campylobacter sp. JMF_06 NA1]|uniref:translation initiation factor IF-2 n=1 Tax=Campylobacter sp. JMF_06 NA1 TaxID=2983823 RepID=UPI0022E9A5A0|nr:translation initiation factor IF-2 [Campylobacter sp. JMF_06 NA1]MDA3077326.1 translation initiation factor IF-2 [Campylobacter sp. JMF_06 NA1]
MAEGVKISDIAAELGYASKDIIEKAQEMGYTKVKTASNKVSNEEAAAIYEYIQTGILPESLKPKSSAKKAPAKPKKQSETKKDEPKKTQSKKTEPKVENSQSKEPKSEPKAQKSEPKEEKLHSQPKSETKIEAKAEVKTEPKSKPEAQTPQINSGESLASESLQKRRGLVIVKKKKDTEAPKVEKPSESREKVSASLEAIFSNAELNLKKKKAEKKKIAVSKKEDTQKIDLVSDHELADIVIDDDEDMVVLPDLTVKPIQVENKTKTKNQPNIYKGSQTQFYGNDTGISRGSRKKHKKVVKKDDEQSVTSVNIPKEIRVYEFAEKIKKQPSEIISKLFLLGMMTTKNDFLDEDAIEILAEEFGIEVNIVNEAEEFDYVKAYEDEIVEENLTTRVPVITIMGHVDHGKTSLLDFIRNSRVVSGEAGGITQHVGAYMVEKNGRNITFIDTPGHEAFTSMRARGAEVTDIVIIVVAADDGVKPQTKEAVNHAKAAGVPIIIAINKMDKENANPDLVKTGLAELDIMPTEWGGSYEFVPISAKTGMGIEDLLEIVLLQADLLELKADKTRQAKATIIESSLQKGRGPVATVIVQNGTLKVGDTVVAGVAYGKVRALNDDKGKKLSSIAPGECGVIIGLSEVPEAGETLIGVGSDKEAREYASRIYEHQRQKELSKSTKVTIDELSAKIAEGELKSLPVIVKADVVGSLEAIKASLEKLRNDEVKVNIIHSGVGGITQNDVGLASASENCVILGFNIRPTGEVKEKAKERGVEIKTYNVIYNLLDDVKAILGGLMSPIIREEDLGQAEIRQVINVPKIGQIAGCMVTEGSIQRGAKIRVIRDGVVVFEGNISSLKRFKDDAKEVAKGFECGVGIDGYNDMRVGDFIESFKEKEEQATL